jgi:hypothetical protein
MVHRRRRVVSSHHLDTYSTGNELMMCVCSGSGLIGSSNVGAEELLVLSDWCAAGRGRVAVLAADEEQHALHAEATTDRGGRRPVARGAGAWPWPTPNICLSLGSAGTTQSHR